MKKIFLSLVAIGLLASCANSGKKAESGAVSDSASNSTVSVNAGEAPVFNFEKSSYDFGKITQGESVTYDFKFKNVGKTPLIITDATATCGCTKPEFPKTPIAPNESGNIHVTFNSAGKEGMQNKVITVTANTVPQQTELHLIGEVNVVKAK
ncbi:MAG: hypothetical protein JWQ25_1646 [Daejeonella sp.]|nr:hypothetical protein [Daejeonella sp.]